MFKDKILARIRVKYANKGLSEKNITTLADRLDGDVTEETQVDAVVDGVEPFLNIIQSEVDIRVDKLKTKQPEGDGGGQGAGKQPEGGAGADANKNAQGQGGEPMPAWAQTLIDSNKQLQEDLSAFKTGSVTSTRLGKVTEKLAGVSDAERTKLMKAYNRMKFETDADFEDFFTNDLTPDVEALVQKKATDDLGQGHRPFVGATSTSTPQQAVDEIKAWRAAPTSTQTAK